MDVDFQYRWREPLSPSEINALFDTVGWPQFSKDQLQSSFDCTWNWLACRFSDGRLVGFARILSDGLLHAYICSMVVHSGFQNRGIGSAMMARIMALCDENSLKPVLKTKTDKKILHFYRNFGFKSEKDGTCALVY